MKRRRIILVAGLHLTATDRAYINAILDAGQQTGHRKGGLHVTLQRTYKKREIENYRYCTIRWRRAQDIENHTVKGRLYAVEIRDRDGRTTRHIVDIVEPK